MRKNNRTRKKFASACSEQKKQLALACTNFTFFVCECYWC